MDQVKKILVVDDEPDLLRGLIHNLKFEGYSVDAADDGNIALKKILENKYDLIILDIMMPGMSGFDVCKNARQQGIITPIILLTAKGEEIDKVLGLELGADDYITKPFSLRELLARIKAVLRRTSTFSEEILDEIKIGLLNVNLKTYEATTNNKVVKMSSKEIDILNFLYSHKGESVDRYDIISNVWEPNSEVTTRTIDNFIVKLRQKIEQNPSNPKHIITIHGKGYKINP
jgi:two-component system response regulator VicR